MFWKQKKNKSEFSKVDPNSILRKRNDFPYTKRECWLFISEKYNEILFVPMGQIDPWKSSEIDSVIVKGWPIDFGELQDDINKTLDKWMDGIPDIESTNENWYSFKSSKAKTQRSFNVDYIKISLSTDLDKKYKEDEAERIVVKAKPFGLLPNNYMLIGKGRLLGTVVAQIVLDIYKGCQKIKKN